MPAISIVTVSFNAVSTIEQTIHSVVGQTYSEIEYIVVDGQSTDGTVDVIAKHQCSLSSWVSEADEGIGDAMNKGLFRATGQYVVYLNADDYLIDYQVIERIAPLLDGDIVTAPIVRLEKDGTMRTIRSRGFDWWFNFKIGTGFHQSIICSREMLTSLGGFNSKYKVTMDYDLFLRAHRRGVRPKVIDEPFTIMRAGGVSCNRDFRSLKARLMEEKSIHIRYCPNTIMLIVYQLYWCAYFPYKLTLEFLRRRNSERSKS